ncbi:hypothetical protein, partial [Pseudoneobacillus sp. C159]
RWLAEASIDGSPPRLTLSQDLPRWQRWYRQRVLAHEAIHLAGYDHMPEVHYVTTDILDWLTSRVQRDVKSGTPRFVPERFGITV